VSKNAVNSRDHKSWSGEERKWRWSARKCRPNRIWPWYEAVVLCISWIVMIGLLLGEWTLESSMFWACVLGGSQGIKFARLTTWLNLVVLVHSTRGWAVGGCWAFLCGRDRPARQPLAVHIISQITFMVGSGGKLRQKSKSCLSSPFAYTRVVSYSSGGEWKLGGI